MLRLRCGFCVGEGGGWPAGGWVVRVEGLEPSERDSTSAETPAKPR